MERRRTTALNLQSLRADIIASVLHFTVFVQCHTVRKWSFCLLTFHKAYIFCITDDKNQVSTRTVSPAVLFLAETLVNEAGGFRDPLILSN